jgi:hypothetical protein
VEDSKVRIILAVLATILFCSETTQAAKVKKDQITAQREDNCKAQARKQYPGARFLKRRAYVNRCMGRIILNKDAAPRKPRPVHPQLMERIKSSTVSIG